MSDIMEKIKDFLTGADIDRRHEQLAAQVKNLQKYHDDEITRLRPELAAAIAERDSLRAENARLREALRPFLEYPSLVDKDEIRAARAAMGESDEVSR